MLLCRYVLHDMHLLILVIADMAMIDDSHLNCKHAEARGWTTVHLVEPGLPIPRIPACKYMVHSLEDLRVHFPHLFKQTNGTQTG